MKVLVSTKDTQGRRGNDFNWTNDMELLLFPIMECSRGQVDDHCGCRRSMSGVESYKSTTTMKVVEHPMLDASAVIKLYSKFFQNAWKMTELESSEYSIRMAYRVMKAIASLKEGDVVERRGRDKLIKRN